MVGEQSVEEARPVEIKRKGNSPKNPAREGSRGKFLDFFHRMKERSPLPSKASWEDVLIRAKHGRNKEIPDNVMEIDLASLGKGGTSLGDDLESMTEKTISDPTHREVGKVMRIRKWLGRTRIFSEEEARYGTKNYFRTKTDLEKHIRNNIRYGRVAAVPHIHPIDMPPSPEDVRDLLLSSRDLYANLGVIVGTVQRSDKGNVPGRKILVFRGPNAVRLTPKEANKIVEDWNVEIGSIVQFGSFTKNETEFLQIQRKAQDSILLRRSQQLGLKVFIAEPGSSVAVLQTPQQVQNRP